MACRSDAVSIRRLRRLRGPSTRLTHNTKRKDYVHVSHAPSQSEEALTRHAKREVAWSGTGVPL